MVYILCPPASYSLGLYCGWEVGSSRCPRNQKRPPNGFVNGGESDQSKSSCVLRPSRRALESAAVGGRWLFFYFIRCYDCTQTRNARKHLHIT